MRAMDCADYIVDTAIKTELSITNLQLQKALYVFAAEYIRQLNIYPYDDDRIMAWNYGPVLPEVYREYKNYESRPIREVSKHETFDVKNCEFTEHIYNDGVDLNDVICPRYQTIVENNLKDFLSLDIFEVVDFTHKQDFWNTHQNDIYIHDDVAYPIKEIHLDNQSLTEFIDNMR